MKVKKCRRCGVRVWGRAKLCASCARSTAGSLEIGDVFGSWTVIGSAIPGPKGRVARYPCRCRCGAEGMVEKRGASELHSRSCRACARPMEAFVGLRVGSRTIIRRDGPKDLWWRCDCGVVSRNELSVARKSGCRRCVAAPRFEGVPVRRDVLDAIARVLGCKRDTLRSKIQREDVIDRISFTAEHGSARPEARHAGSGP